MYWKPGSDAHAARKESTSTSNIWLSWICSKPAGKYALSAISKAVCNKQLLHWLGIHFSARQIMPFPRRKATLFMNGHRAGIAGEHYIAQLDRTFPGGFVRISAWESSFWDSALPFRRQLHAFFLCNAVRIAIYICIYLWRKKLMVISS